MSGAELSRRGLLAGGLAVPGGGLIRGGMPPRRLDQVRQPMTPGVTPGSPNVIKARRVIIAGPGDGVFVYQAGTTPALGNPPIVWITGGGSLIDPYGNVLPSTAGVAAAGTFQAGDSILSTLGLLTYSGTPSVANPPIGSVAPAAGTDQFGFVFDKGINAYTPFGATVYAVGLNQTVAPTLGNVPGLAVTDLFAGPFSPAGFFAASSGSAAEATAGMTSGQRTGADVAALIYVLSQLVSAVTGGTALIAAGQTTIGHDGTVLVDDNRGALYMNALLAASPGPAGTGFGLWPNINGTPNFVLPSGQAGPAELAVTSNQSHTNANAAGQTQTSTIFTIDAADAQTGTFYILALPWSATMQGQTLQLGLSIDGGAYTVSDTISGAIVGAGVGLNGWVFLVIQVDANGVGPNNAQAFLWGVMSQNAAAKTFTNSGSIAGKNTSFTFDTTATHTMQLATTWGAAAAGQTVTGYGATFTRTGP